MNKEHPDGSLCNAMNFIHLKMLEMATDCGNTVQNGLITFQYGLQLQDKLEKILHEIRATCTPPKRQPVMSDFETLKCLGTGSFGTVNLVCHKETGQNLAMKMIARETVTETSKANLLMERDILLFSDNPFVVSMFCTFQTEAHYCMVMEYAGGGDCESLLRRYKRLPVELARIYVAETVLALEYLHSYGILHADLKPGNMLITSTGHIKLADFGVSKIGPVNMTNRNDLKKKAKEFLDSNICGTSWYMAPEVIKMKGYGKPVDWWALGIILYEFLVGEVPFQGDSDDEIYDQVVSTSIDWSQVDPALPTDAKDIIKRLLSKNIGKRLGTDGVSDVKAHPFFKGLDWNNLLNQEIPQLEDEEETAQSNSDDDHSSNSDDDHASSSCDEDEESPAEIPDFCRIAFRFKEVYSSLEHLPVLNPQSATPGNDEVEEEQREDQEQGCETEAHPVFQGLDSNNTLNQEVLQLEDEEKTAQSNSDDVPSGDKSPVDYKTDDNCCSDGPFDEDPAGHASHARVVPQMRTLQVITRTIMMASQMKTSLVTRPPVMVAPLMGTSLFTRPPIKVVPQMTIPLAITRPIMTGLLMRTPLAITRPTMTGLVMRTPLVTCPSFVGAPLMETPLGRARRFMMAPLMRTSPFIQ